MRKQNKNMKVCHKSHVCVSSYVKKSQEHILPKAKTKKINQLKENTRRVNNNTIFIHMKYLFHVCYHLVWNGVLQRWIRN